MNICNVKVRKLSDSARVPTYGSDFSAGADLYLLSDAPITINAGKTEVLHTGIALEIPQGLVGLIYARSGLACKRGLAPANKVGVIDSDYRGEIMVVMYNQSENDAVIEPGERIAQIVFTPYMRSEFTVCDVLEDTARGTGGFGSTGNK